MTQSLELPIDKLCIDLAAEFSRDVRGPKAAEILAGYASSEARDWREWVFFETERYTRNLVHRCGDYELLLLCWGAGQSSPIHDHAGQQCWMAVLDGTVEEVHYRAGEGELAVGAVRRFETGQVAFIQDEIALHLVRATPEMPAVSLHLYSNPIDACRVYDADSGEEGFIEVGYHSVRGELCGAKSAETVRAEWV